MEGSQFLILNIWECVLHESIKDFKHLMISDVKGYIDDINMQYLGREVREKSDIFMRQVQSNIFTISCYYGNFNICNISLLL